MWKDQLLKNMYKILNLLAILFLVYLMSSTLLAPKPFEATLTSPLNGVEVCEGGSFSYTAQTKIVRSPTTLLRVETWYSVEEKMNVIPDSLGEAEAYNWRKGMSGSIVRTRQVEVPKQLKPGEYEYIVNFNSFGINTPSSFWIPVTVKSCPSTQSS